LHGCGQQQGGQPAAGNALGVVNGAPVSEQAFQQRIQLRQANLPSALGGANGEVSVALKRRVVWELIDEKLLNEEAARRDVTIADADVQQALTAFKAGFANHAAYEQYLANYPGGLTALQIEQRASLLRSRLAGAAPAVSDSDVAQYYEQHKDLYQHPAYLLADEIVLLDKASRNEAAELSSLRQHIVNDGLSFQHQARKHSEADTAQQGGAMGHVTSSSVRPEIWNAIHTLAAGQISAPIALPDRTLLVRVRDRVAASSKSLAQMSAEIRKQLTLRLQRTRESELIAELRANATARNQFEASEQAAPTLSAGKSAADLLGQDLKQGDTALLARPGS
jgi:foldase protein PrsA